MIIRFKNYQKCTAIMDFYSALKNGKDFEKIKFEAESKDIRPGLLCLLIAEFFYFHKKDYTTGEGK